MLRAMLAICPVGVTYHSIDITDQLVDSGGELDLVLDRLYVIPSVLQYQKR